MLLIQTQVFSLSEFKSKQRTFFQDFLVVFEVTLYSSVHEKLKWMSRLLDIDNKRRIHMNMLETAIDLLDQLEDAIPDEHYDNPDEYLRKEKPSKPVVERSKPERLNMLRSFLTPDIHDLISIRTFKAIPARIISAREF